LKQKELECRRDPRIDQLADALKALSDTNRLRIMCFLSAGERCVCEVESELRISQQLASHHLNVLREAGFLVLKKRGTWSYYSVDADSLRKANEYFLRYLDFKNVVSGADAPACCK
jgi:ArsR family transcriptional regulator